MQTDTRKRNKMSAEKKYSIILEIQQNKTTKTEILRREGLYTADIQRFEETAREGAIRALRLLRPGRKKKIQQDVTPEEHNQLKQELARKEKALAELATEFTILKKKVNGE